MLFGNRQSKWFILIAGLIFVILGAVILLNPTEAIVLFVTIFGIAMLFLAMWHTAEFIVARNSMFQPYWKIGQAVLDTLFGLLLIIYRHYAAVAITVIIGGWLLVTGIVRIASIFADKKLNTKMRMVQPMTGLIGIILGGTMLWLVRSGHGMFAAAAPVGIAVAFFGLMLCSEFLVLHRL